MFSHCCNHFCFKPMNLLAGLETAAQEAIPVDLEAAESEDMYADFESADQENICVGSEVADNIK